MNKFKENNPVEAAALEVAITALLEEAKRKPRCRSVVPEVIFSVSVAPGIKENPDRAGFISDLFEAAGFSVRYDQGGVPGWIVKE